MNNAKAFEFYRRQEKCSSLLLPSSSFLLLPKNAPAFPSVSRHHPENLAPSEGRDLTLTSLPFFPIIPTDFRSPIVLLLFKFF